MFRGFGKEVVGFRYKRLREERRKDIQRGGHKALRYYPWRPGSFVTKWSHDLPVDPSGPLLAASPILSILPGTVPLLPATFPGPYP